jgi:hypothetical protein
MGILGLFSTLAKGDKPANGVSVAGYGVTLQLLPPFQVNRLSGQKTPDKLILANTGAKLKNALISPGSTIAPSAPLKKEWLGTPGQGVWEYRQGADGTSVALGVGMKDLSEVATFAPGPSERLWFIRTTTYQVKWPPGFKMVSTTSPSQWPFELQGLEGSMIFLRGPLRGAKDVPTPPQLVAPDQKVVNEGSLGHSIWIELEYRYEGAVWRQRHYYGILAKETVVLVTGQAPATHAAELAKACDLIVESLTAPK